jgi:uncharacterized protein (DUF1697 family)
MIKTMSYVALLRGINVGGNTIISMATLKECFEKLGYKNVKTYINSGNVIFQSTVKDPRELEKQIEKLIRDNFTLDVMVVTRSYDEMNKVIKAIPKNWDKPTDYKYNVIFLNSKIDNPSILNGLQPKSEIEELHYHPGVLLWAAKTSDLTKSNMVKLSKNSIYKQMTVRNLNTTKKVFELMKDLKT